MRDSRFEPERIKYKHFTERDKKVVESVFFARYLTSQQIQRLHFGSDTRANYRLHILVANGYLRKRKVGYTDCDIYFLKAKGKHYIEEELKYEREYVKKVSGIPETSEDAPMKHDLTLSNLYVEATLECKAYGWELEWENTQMLKQRSLGFEPDAYLRVTKSKSKEAFIEYTSATTSYTEIRKKLLTYEGYFQAEHFTPVLWFISSRAKLNLLRKLVTESIYAEYFLIGSIEDKSGYLTKAMWHLQGSEDKIRFLSPPETMLLDLVPRL